VVFGTEQKNASSISSMDIVKATKGLTGGPSACIPYRQCLLLYVFNKKINIILMQ
jgi:hypothetical protein